MTQNRVPITRLNKFFSEEDFNLDFPYLIDVEDTSYSYATEEERDNDYEELCKILTKNTTKYFYN